MPLFKVDVYNNYSIEKLKQVIDIIHKNATLSFKSPEKDRYQIVTKLRKEETVSKDTDLSFKRTCAAISIQIFSSKREQYKELNFYKNVVNELNEKLKISNKELLISFFENIDLDYHFPIE